MSLYHDALIVARKDAAEAKEEIAERKMEDTLPQVHPRPPASLSLLLCI